MHGAYPRLHYICGYLLDPHDVSISFHSTNVDDACASRLLYEEINIYTRVAYIFVIFFFFFFFAICCALECVRFCHSKSPHKTTANFISPNSNLIFIHLQFAKYLKCILRVRAHSQPNDPHTIYLYCTSSWACMHTHIFRLSSVGLGQKWYRIAFRPTHHNENKQFEKIISIWR